jgi:hypothetical protein
MLEINTHWQRLSQALVTLYESRHQEMLVRIQEPWYNCLEINTGI